MIAAVPCKGKTKKIPLALPAKNWRRNLSRLPKFCCCRARTWEQDGYTTGLLSPDHHGEGIGVPMTAKKIVKDVFRLKVR
jgi:hypothetical protein